MRTYSPKADEIERAWHLVDADGLVLGRLATEVARILRGKHQPFFAPHIDTGDHVVVVNAAKVVLTSGKAGDKFAYRHSGYPGGLKRPSYADLLADAARGGRPPGRAGHDPEEHASAASSWPSSRSTPAPTTPTPPSNPEPLDLPDARART